MEVNMHPSLRKTLLVLCIAGLGGCLAAQKQPAAKTPPAPPAKESPAAPAKKSAFDKAVLEAYLRHRYLWNPQVTVQIGAPKPSRQLPGLEEVPVHLSWAGGSMEEVFLVSKDGQKVVKGEVYDIAQNPFKPDLDKLKTEFQPSFGTPGATVVLVLFTDFECPYCRSEAKMLRDNLLSAFPKQVRVYFKDFPLQQIHPWAKIASIAGRCVFRQNPAAFWQYHDWVYEHQSEINEANFNSQALEFAKGKEDAIDTLQLSRCMETRATEAEVDKNIADGRALQVMSTPTMFVNGRRLVGQLEWPNLRQIVEAEIEYQKTARNAGEDCGCEIKLPSPLNH
jgi:protein-disulfide isomerase